MNCDASPPRLPAAVPVLEEAAVLDDDESGWYFNANSLNRFWIVSNEEDGETPRTLNGFLGTLDNILPSCRSSFLLLEYAYLVVTS